MGDPIALQSNGSDPSKSSNRKTGTTIDELKKTLDKRKNQPQV
jgi:hypothetical protein